MKTMIESDNHSASVISIAEPIKKITAKLISSTVEEYEILAKQENKYLIENSGKYIILKEHGRTKNSFLKKEVFENFTESLHEHLSYTQENITNENVKETLKKIFGADGSKYTLKELVQRVGFDGILSVFGEDVFIRQAIENIHLSYEKNIFVSDIHLPYEVEKITEVFKNHQTFYIEKNDSTSVDNHMTEKLLETIPFDIKLNNNHTIADFTNQIKNTYVENFSQFKNDKKKELISEPHPQNSSLFEECESYIPTF